MEQDPRPVGFRPSRRERSVDAHEFGALLVSRRQLERVPGRVGCLRDEVSEEVFSCRTPQELVV